MKEINKITVGSRIGEFSQKYEGILVSSPLDNDNIVSHYKGISEEIDELKDYLLDIMEQKHIDKCHEFLKIKLEVTFFSPEKENETFNDIETEYETPIIP